MWNFKYIFRRKKKHRHAEIEPDEIFLDARNLPDLDVSQFEGRLEKPISKKVVYLFGFFFLLVVTVFIFQLANLQAIHGDEYKALAEKNRLESSIIFSSRGIITDRNGEELAWNEKKDGQSFATRVYSDFSGLSHLLGYVSTPQADDKGVFYRTDSVGKQGVEKAYDATLSGRNGKKIVETDALRRVVSENVTLDPVPGQDLTLSIDERVQKQLYQEMTDLADKVGFHGGAGLIMNVHTGELLAMTSFPGYDSNIMTRGDDRQAIVDYNNNSNAPFLYRAVGGLYAPGSIVKPFVALGALNEGIVTADTIIVSTGSISIPNPYYPDKPSIFPDWKALGPLNLKQAIAYSSDVYFYELGGGYKDQKGLGIEGLNKYYKMFGLGAQPTGIALHEVLGNIPNPDWKREVFPENPDWNLGDTYHTSIGQYGMQVTPLQMVRADAAIANGGKLLTPTIIKQNPASVPTFEALPILEKDFRIVRDGMRLGALEGTAKGLNMSRIHIAAKTGTAELGPGKHWVNSWVMGFYPYEDPKYAFVVVMEKGPYDNLLGGVYVMRRMFEWMLIHTPEYVEFGVQ